MLAPAIFRAGSTIFAPCEVAFAVTTKGSVHTPTLLTFLVGFACPAIDFLVTPVVPTATLESHLVTGFGRATAAIDAFLARLTPAVLRTRGAIFSFLLFTHTISANLCFNASPILALLVGFACAAVDFLVTPVVPTATLESHLVAGPGRAASTVDAFLARPAPTIVGTGRTVFTLLLFAPAVSTVFPHDTPALHATFSAWAITAVDPLVTTVVPGPAFKVHLVTGFGCATCSVDTFLVRFAPTIRRAVGAVFTLVLFTHTVSTNRCFDAAPLLANLSRITRAVLWTCGTIFPNTLFALAVSTKRL